MSEGRGTTRPFELVGAPWVDRDPERSTRRPERARTGRRALPAGLFRADVPQARRRSACGGCQIHVTDRARVPARRDGSRRDRGVQTRRTRAVRMARSARTSTRTQSRRSTFSMARRSFVKVSTRAPQRPSSRARRDTWRCSFLPMRESAAVLGPLLPARARPRESAVGVLVRMACVDPQPLLDAVRSMLGCVPDSRPAAGCSRSSSSAVESRGSATPAAMSRPADRNGAGGRNPPDRSRE